MAGRTPLQRAILVFESRSEWLRRHAASGLHADYARALPPDDEIIMLRDLLTGSGLTVESHEISVATRAYLKTFLDDKSRDFIFWNLSDGEQDFLGGLIPALCQLFDWPYFGSRAYTQGICQHKDHWKSILGAAEIPTPQWRTFTSRNVDLSVSHVRSKVSEVLLPHFVKAAHLGNSAGFSDIFPLSTSVVETTEKIERMFERGISEVLVEEYIGGREYTVGAAHFDQWELIAFEQIYDGPFIDQSIKDVFPGRTLSQEQFYDPQLDADARQIIGVLGIKDYCRIDFRRDREGAYKVIDVNCTPFMTGWTFTSLSQSRGYSRADFFRELLEESFERQNPLKLAQS
jgi:D-alanine-D-alanine ligase-like ATP-grasp enzyme